MEISLIDCKGELSLNWIENCGLNSAGLNSAAVGANVDSTGSDSVTLSAEDNAKL